MATDPKAPSLSNVSAPLPPPIDTFFAIGEDDRPTDNRIVACSIGLRCEFKVGDRDASGVYLAHEICVLRRFYEARAGNGLIRPTGGWPPGLDRYRRLTHNDLTRERDRLNKMVVVLSGGRVASPFKDLFGGTPAEQLTRLHSVMRNQLEAWQKLLARAKTRIPPGSENLNPMVLEAMACDLMTEREVEELVLMADPSTQGLEEMTLPEISAPSAPFAQAAAEDKPDDLDACMARLDAVGVKKQQALELASLLEMSGGADKITDDQIAKIAGGKGMLSAIKGALRG